jgi:argininosuccinate lyase
MNECPLGSAALAGTGFPIDREMTAQALGFDRPTANSLDAVSDRDFVLETLNAAALTALHLSRLAEDLIIYTTEEFGFFTLDDGVTSGSSLMPQKKNPDALELIRGKVGRIIGAQTGLAVTLKGLPLAYNKDLQEDKEPLFDAMDNLSMCLRMLPRVFAGIVVHADRARAAAEGGYANATDLADYLVDKGVPFRDAHEFAGRIVRLALAKRIPIERLSLDEMRGVSALIEADIVQRLELSSVLGKRAVVGGTAPARVREAVMAARSRVEAMRGRVENDKAIKR